MKSRYEHFRFLACSEYDWDAYVSYEATWSRCLCEPDDDLWPVIIENMHILQRRLSWLEFCLYRLNKVLEDYEA